MKALKTLIAIALSAGGLGTAVTLSAVGNKVSNENIQVVVAEGDERIVRCTYPNGWDGAMHCHYWGGATETKWPGVSETGSYKNAMNQTVVYFTIPSDTTYIIFNDDSSGHQTVNIDASEGVAWYCNGGFTEGKYNTSTFIVETLHFYLYDYNNSFSSPKAECWTNNVSQTGWSYTLTADQNSSGRIYTVVTDEMANRVKFSDNGSNETAELTLTANYAYKLDSSEWWDNINYVRAHDWAMNLMHMRDYDTSLSGEGTGLCETYYPTAKTVYDSFDSNIIGEINNGFANAVARYNHWASVVGASSNGSNFIAQFDNKHSLVLILTITAISGISVLGLFFLLRRKRKEQ